MEVVVNRNSQSFEPLVKLCLKGENRCVPPLERAILIDNAVN